MKTLMKQYMDSRSRSSGGNNLCFHWKNVVAAKLPPLNSYLAFVCVCFLQFSS